MYAPDEIMAMHDRNENFVGRQPDFEKIGLYQKIKAELEQLKDCTVNGYEPNRHEQNALLWVDMPSLVALDKKAARALAKAISMADKLFISESGGKIRFAFGIEHVWKR